MAIKYNDKLISEISRDKLHREIQRTQGSLTARFKRDPLGRLAKQLAGLNEASLPTSGQIVERIYQYDEVGNLIQTQDKRFGTTHYRYDKLGQIQLAGQELFHFDPAHNLIEREQQKITNNQIEEYQDITYQYDEFGNLSQRTFPNGEVQYYAYNAKDQLIEATIQKPNQLTETWQYQYDVLGRRISKRLKNGENLQETRFVWDGSHLVQEENANSKYSYIYTHPSSYEPLAQLHFAKNRENPTACTAYYYHNDQIGVPRALTDEDSKPCWYFNKPIMERIMKFEVTLISAEPFTLTGKLRESIEIEADNIDEAKRLGHMQIARQNRKTYPIYGVSVEAVEIQ